MDVDGVWHIRPADDDWTPYPALAQARTGCGRAIASTASSPVHPDRLPQPPDDPEEMCQECPEDQPATGHTP